MFNPKHFGKMISKVRTMSRSTLGIVLVLCLLAVMLPTGIGILSVSAADEWDGSIAAGYEGGSGSEADPFRIGTGAQLAYLSQQISQSKDRGKYFKLTADIDLNDHPWTPIGFGTSASKSFWGTFDGDGHTITGLNYSFTAATGGTNGVGLFGRVGQGYGSDAVTITNLHVEGSVKTTFSMAGGIIGRSLSHKGVTMTNCSFSGSVETGTNAYAAFCGGLIGYAKGQTTIEDCYTTGTIAASKTTAGQPVSGVGGLIGEVREAPDSNMTWDTVLTVKNCYSTSAISTTDPEADGVGGLIGCLSGDLGKNGSGTRVTREANLTNCYYNGTISTAGIAGGLVGSVNRYQDPDITLNINNCYSLADMTACTGTSGGLFGAIDSADVADVNTQHNDNVTINLNNSVFAGSGAKAPVMYNADSTATNECTHITVDAVYYKQGSYAATEGTPAGATEKTAAEFESGDVAALLNVTAAEKNWTLWAATANGVPAFAVMPKVTGIALSLGTIEFDPEVFEYEAFVALTTPSVKVTPEGAEGTTLKVNGTVVDSGTASAEIPLTAESTDITVVGERDGVEITYTVTVTRQETMWDNTVATEYAGGTGTEDDPYIIETGAQMMFMAAQINGKKDVDAHFKLMADIDFNGNEWTPIENFIGTLNGNGKTISGFVVKATAWRKGFFGVLGADGKTTTIKNLTLKGSSLRNGGGYLGGFAGATFGNLTFENCHYEGDVIATAGGGDPSSIGGFVGQLANGTTTIIDSSFKGTVSGNAGIGGFAGWVDTTLIVTNSTMDGTVTGTGYGVGGMAGAVFSASAKVTITDSTMKGKVTGTGYGAGGLIGHVKGSNSQITISGSSADVEVTGNNYGVGGLVGANEANSSTFVITNCFSKGSVSAPTASGWGTGATIGFVKCTGSGSTNTISNCYTTMNVTSSHGMGQYGGLFGFISGSDNGSTVLLKNCHFAGSTKNKPVGYAHDRLTAENVYYKAGCCTAGSVVDTNEAPVNANGAAAEQSADAFAGSAVTDLLNQGVASSGGLGWANGTEGYPVLGSKSVVLSDLALSNGMLTFAPNTYTYNTFVINQVDKITVTPKAEAGATIKVNGEAVQSGSASQAIALTVGTDNVISVEVKTAQGTTYYVVNIERRDPVPAGIWDGTYEPFDTSDKKGTNIDNPILIENGAQLAFLAAMVNGQSLTIGGVNYVAPASNDRGRIYEGTYFKLTADITLNIMTDYENWATKAPYNNWAPIGFLLDTDLSKLKESRFFSGVLDGDSHTVTGLYCVRGADHLNKGTGLFGATENATIRNLHIKQSYVEGYRAVGGLVGNAASPWFVTDGTKLQNCSYSGTVVSNWTDGGMTDVGGLIGYVYPEIDVNSCWTEGTVIGGDYVGGLVGQVRLRNEGLFYNCYSSMTVVTTRTTPNLAAGLFGGVVDEPGYEGTLDLRRMHFAGSVPTGKPILGNTVEGTLYEVEDVFYRADSFTAPVDETLLLGAVEKSVDEFKDGTVTKLLNDAAAYGDFWNWKDGENGYPVSDGVLLVTDYRVHTDDSGYNNSTWADKFVNKDGGILDNDSNNGGSDDGNNGSPITGEKSIYVAVIVLLLASAIAVFVLARKKRSVNN